MPNPFRTDPGPCPVCGAAHSACTAPNTDSLAVPQLPARDAAMAASRAAALSTHPPTAPASALDEADAADSFTTATYRGPKGKRK